MLPGLPVGRISLLQAGEYMNADGNVGMLSSVVSGPSRDRAPAFARAACRNARRRALHAPQSRGRRIRHHADGRVDRPRLAARQPRRRSAFGRARARAAPEAAARRTRASEESTREMRSASWRPAASSSRSPSASAMPRRAASRARTAITRTCSASSKASAPDRRNPRCAASASRRRPPKSRASSTSARTRWRVPAPSSTAAWSRSMRSTRAAPNSKPSAKIVARRCRLPVAARRPRSSRAATC